MKIDILKHDDTSVSIINNELTTASPVVFELPAFHTTNFPYTGTGVWVDNLVGLILKWQNQWLNLDSNQQQRHYFFSFANSLKTFTDEIEERVTQQIIYEQRHTNPSTLFPNWEQQLEQLKQLPVGWDSYGASPVSNLAIDKAKSILSVAEAMGIAQLSFIVPCPDGGIQLEWDFEGKEIVLVIPRTGERTTFLLVETTSTGEEIEKEGAIRDTEHLQQLLSRVEG